LKKIKKIGWSYESYSFILLLLLQIGTKSTSCFVCQRSFSRIHNMRQHEWIARGRNHPYIQITETYLRITETPPPMTTMMRNSLTSDGMFKFLHPFTMIVAGPTMSGEIHLDQRIIYKFPTSRRYNNSDWVKHFFFKFASIVDKKKIVYRSSALSTGRYYFYLLFYSSIFCLFFINTCKLYFDKKDNSIIQNV
jgi:hypothetical protein